MYLYNIYNLKTHLENDILNVTIATDKESLKTEPHWKYLEILLEPYHIIS